MGLFAHHKTTLLQSFGLTLPLSSSNSWVSVYLSVWIFHGKANQGPSKCDQKMGAERCWKSLFPHCYPFLTNTDGEVSRRLLARGTVGMLASRDYPLEHFPRHLTLPNGWSDQSVLPHHHPSTGMSLIWVSGILGRGQSTYREIVSRHGFLQLGRQNRWVSSGKGLLEKPTPQSSVMTKGRVTSGHRHLEGRVKVKDGVRKRARHTFILIPYP